MYKNIVVSGCSYSCVHTDKDSPMGYWPEEHFGYNPVYPEYIRNSKSINVDNISKCGLSNTSILKSIYDNVVGNTIPTMYIIQLTHLHRMGYYCDVTNCWIDLQPLGVTQQPESTENGVDWEFSLDDNRIEIRNGMNPSESPAELSKLREAYNTHLQLAYNEDKEFEYIMYQCDMLKNYISSNNHSFLFIYWPLITPSYITKLDELNFLKIDDMYSIQEWSTKNNLLGMDAHLSPYGHELLSNHILNSIKL